MQTMQGIRVVEVAEWTFVPAAATVLADWGAEVLKVEHPEHGDGIRGLISSGIVPGAAGANFFVEQQFRNKKSVGIDISTETGRQILYRLVERADVFITSMLPDAREKFGITFEDIRKVNSKIIYAKGTGYGPKGPDSRRGGYDGLSFWMRGGPATCMTTPGEPFVQQRAAFGDFTGGMFIAGGIAGALFHRERTGEAVEVDVSLLGQACWMLSPDMVAAMLYGGELPRGNLLGAPNPLVAPYECADGRHLQIMMLQAEKFWPRFLEAIGRSEILEDDRYNTPEKRAAASEELHGLLTEHFRTRDRDVWMKALQPTDCIFGAVQSPLEVVEDPQVQANQYVLPLDHPEYGEIRLTSSPVQFGGEPVEIRNAAPEVGADTELTLVDLGCTWDEIAEWKEKNVIS
jgi:crotonobetainyl-CoA:carnitine CoA-transferase CaiB-like acyl-CoA transferase